MVISITAEQLKFALPRCSNPTGWAAPLNDAMLLHGIAFDADNVVEFLAQAAHESAQFNRLVENLYYSAERLVQVWPQRFPTVAAAVPYAGRPEALANFVYGGRLGNGPADSGDGYRYRGRGLLQVTGRANYQRVAKLIGDPVIINCPDRLCTKAVACHASAAWWSSQPELARLANEGDTLSITRIVNGGTAGLAERQKLRDAFADALNGAR